MKKSQLQEIFTFWKFGFRDKKMASDKNNPIKNAVISVLISQLHPYKEVSNVLPNIQNR